MASVVYQAATAATYENTIDWEADTFKGRLVRNTTTCDTEPDVTAWSGFTLDDECDDSNYVSGGIELTSKVIAPDNGTDLMEFSSANVVFGSGTPLAADGAARDYQGMVIVKAVDGGDNDIPLLFVDFTSDVTQNATEITVPCPATGWLTVGQPT